MDQSELTLYVVGHCTDCVEHSGGNPIFCAPEPPKFYARIYRLTESDSVGNQYLVTEKGQIRILAHAWKHPVSEVYAALNARLDAGRSKPVEKVA